MAFPSVRKRKERKDRVLGQVVFYSGPNVWRVIWDRTVYKESPDISPK